MDDNAHVHRARVVKIYMANNNAYTTEWSAQSSDLNIIENIWHRLKREIERNAFNITARDQLIAAIRSAWQNNDRMSGDCMGSFKLEFWKFEEWMVVWPNTK